jgi:hypothetical protein
MCRQTLCDEGGRLAAGEYGVMWKAFFQSLFERLLSPQTARFILALLAQGDDGSTATVKIDQPANQPVPVNDTGESK